VLMSLCGVVVTSVVALAGGVGWGWGAGVGVGGGGGGGGGAIWCVYRADCAYFLAHSQENQGTCPGVGL